MVRLSRPRSFHLVFVLTLAAAFFAVPMHGPSQASKPAVSLGSTVAQPSGSKTQTSDGVATMHVSSNMVVIDVVVTDSKQNPIHGLKASDFTLMENGKPQSISHFEEHVSVPASDLKVTPAPPLRPGIFTNQASAPANGPVNILLLDYLNTPLTAQPYARRELLNYLDKSPAGTRIAIFGMSTHLSILQGFTADKSLLKAALTQSKGTPQASRLLSDAFSGGSSADTSMSDTYSDPDGPASINQEAMDDLTRFEYMQASLIQDERAQYTLNDFDQLARYLMGIPGRKNVIWFSGSFPLDVEPNVDEADPNDSVVRNDDAVRTTDNLLTRAQVALYPVDARGLQTDPANNFASGKTITNTSAMEFMSQTAQEHETMEAMAEDTGGQAFYNTNGLTQAVSKAIEIGSNYYTLSYSPTNMEWDARFRAIKIKMTEPGMKLVYRQGYYAVDPNDKNKVVADSVAMVSTRPSTMVTAMIHGAPDPSEIIFQARIRPANTAPEDEVLQHNQVNPKLKVEGPYREYGVDLVPDARSVSCPASAGGNRHCSIEMWTFVYNSDGEKLITVSDRLHSMLTPKDYRNMLAGKKMAFHQQISVPVKGNYYLRTAIHDMDSDKVGAVEVPVAAVARLNPLQARSDAPASAPTATETPATPAAESPVPTGAAATPQK